MQLLMERLMEEKNMQLKGGLYHYTQVKFAFSSNRIEGNRISEDQIRYIYETNTINTTNEAAIDVDDIIETVNHFYCFDYMLLHADEELSEDLIKEFHLLLKRSTSDERKEWFRVGDYKTRLNAIGHIKTMAPTNVGIEIQKLLAEYIEKKEIAFEDILDFHYRFERIHPFQDGNGRVGRIIMFKECLKNGILPFITDHEHKLLYYRGLKEYETGKEYLIDNCMIAQDEYKREVLYFYPDFIAPDH